MQVEAFLASGVRKKRCRIANDFRRTERSCLEFKAAGLDLGQVEDLVYQCQE